ncbi:hypothetical protein HD806DRAFT_527448 [Xylariaceae sp. AK1471]|nr:hypothetical protein HD806DRAFT_527448 [Xylariaceae sp. AK1471]
MSSARYERISCRNDPIKESLLCSTRRAEKHREYKSENHYSPKPCLSCKQELPLDKYSSKYYCNKKCASIAYYNKRKDEEKAEGAPRPVTPKKCLECKEKFTPSRSSHKYCTAICQTIRNNRRKRRPRKVKRSSNFHRKPPTATPNSGTIQQSPALSRHYTSSSDIPAPSYESFDASNNQSSELAGCMMVDHSAMQQSQALSQYDTAIKSYLKNAAAYGQVDEPTASRTETTRTTRPFPMMTQHNLATDSVLDYTQTPTMTPDDGMTQLAPASLPYTAAVYSSQGFSANIHNPGGSWILRQDCLPYWVPDTGHQEPGPSSHSNTSYQGANFEGGSGAGGDDS